METENKKQNKFWLLFVFAALLTTIGVNALFIYLSRSSEHGARGFDLVDEYKNSQKN